MWRRFGIRKVTICVEMLIVGGEGELVELLGNDDSEEAYLKLVEFIKSPNVGHRNDKRLTIEVNVSYKLF
jgi:hypothetical protein